MYTEVGQIETVLTENLFQLSKKLYEFLLSFMNITEMEWIDTSSTESEELEPVWKERALEVLGEDSEKRDELMNELKNLVEKEKDLKVPDSEHFFLMFLRSGLMDPTAGLGVMKNYFLLKKNHPRYFQVRSQ